MSKLKLISIIAIGLLISNLALVGFMSFGPPKHPKMEGPEKLIREKLHFSEEQIQQHQILIKKHRKNIRQKEDEILAAKNKLYATLVKESTKQERDSLINAISDVQKEIENIHYDHFLEMKAICKPEQQKYFQELTIEIGELFSKRPMPKSRPEK